jgi:hypothetical protein
MTQAQIDKGGEGANEIRSWISLAVAMSSYRHGAHPMAVLFMSQDNREPIATYLAQIGAAEAGVDQLARLSTRASVPPDRAPTVGESASWSNVNCPTLTDRTAQIYRVGTRSHRNGGLAGRRPNLLADWRVDRPPLLGN